MKKENTTPLQVKKTTRPPKIVSLEQEVVDVAVLPLPVIDALIVVDVYYAIDDTAMHGH